MKNLAYLILLFSAFSHGVVITSGGSSVTETYGDNFSFDCDGVATLPNPVWIPVFDNPAPSIGDRHTQRCGDGTGVYEAVTDGTWNGATELDFVPYQPQVNYTFEDVDCNGGLVPIDTSENPTPNKYDQIIQTCNDQRITFIANAEDWVTPIVGSSEALVAPTTNSDGIGLVETIDGTTPELAVKESFRTLSGTTDPVDGTTTAYYPDQLYLNTTSNGFFRADVASTDPDAAATGSVWVSLPASADTNFAITDLTSDADRTHTFDNNLVITGTGAKQLQAIDATNNGDIQSNSAAGFSRIAMGNLAATVGSSVGALADGTVEIASTEGEYKFGAGAVPRLPDAKAAETTQTLVVDTATGKILTAASEGLAATKIDSSAVSNGLQILNDTITGTAFADSIHTSGINEPENLFDNAITDFATDAFVTLPTGFGYQFSAPVIVNNINMTSGDGGFNGARTPSDFTVEGSNDGLSWDVLHTVTGEVWSAPDITTSFPFSNSTQYTYYRVNASNAADVGRMVVRELEFEGFQGTPAFIDTTETLEASTNNGTVRLFTNINIGGVATLAVQSGETLNGVTNGAFLFSNYSAGTQFRADEVAGGWVVSVVGASVDGESLSYLMDLTDITATGTSLSLGTNPSSGAAVVHNDGTATITRIGDKAFCTLRVTSDDDDAIVLTLGSSIVPAGGKILQVGVNGFHRWANESQTVVSSGNTITLNRTTDVNADLTTELSFVTDGWPELNPQVLAGMVTPESLSGVYLRDEVASGTFNTVIQNISVTAPADYNAVQPDVLDLGSPVTTTTKGGKFSISGDAIVSSEDAYVDFDMSIVGDTSTSGSRHFYQLVKNGTEVLALSWTTSATANIEGSTGVTWSGDIQAGDSLEIRVGAQITGTVGVSSYSIRLNEKPSSTVVMPDALEVEDLPAYLFSWDAPNSSILTGTIGYIQIENSTVKKDFGNLATYNGSNSEWTFTSGDNPIKVTSSILTFGSGNTGQITHYWSVPANPALSIQSQDQIVTGINGILGQGVNVEPSVLTIPANATVTARLTHAASSNSQVVQTKSFIAVEEISPTQKTVINTVDTPVDDQSASGYIDIGNTRIQWGSGTTLAGGAAQAVTLPAPFADGQYTVTGSSDGPTFYTRFDGYTTTGFNVQVLQPDPVLGVQGNYRWMAIGIKP